MVLNARIHWQPYFYVILLLRQCASKLHRYLCGIALVSLFFCVLKMSSYQPNKEHLRHVLLFLNNQKKNASENQRILVQTYGNNVLTQDARVRWYRLFKSGDFDLNDKERPGQLKKFDDDDLQKLLDEDDTQTQQQMAEKLNVGRRMVGDRLHAMGKIQKAGEWVPHKLKDRDGKVKNSVRSFAISK